MQVCFLEPDEFCACIDEDSGEIQTITVADVERGKLRVWGTRNSSKVPIKIKKSRLEKWGVPSN